MSDDESMTERGFSPLEDSAGILPSGFPEELLGEHELPHLVTTESLEAGLSGGMVPNEPYIAGTAFLQGHPKPKGRRTGRGPRPSRSSVKEKNLKVPKIAKQPKQP